MTAEMRSTPGMSEGFEAPSAEALAELVASHRELLAYVERRVGDRAVAEEILQDALVKSLGSVGEVRESMLGWFYRVLRNAIIDHARRREVRARKLDELVAETPAAEEPELADAVCRCVTRLVPTLKPEYADALERIEVGGMAVKDYADANGITANNAAARVSRARAALRLQVARACGTCAEHGCVDCTCAAP